jgi:hypothetical protein
MTVGELIEKLKALPPDLICVTHEYGADDSSMVPVGRVEEVVVTRTAGTPIHRKRGEIDDQVPGLCARRVVVVAGARTGMLGEP